MSRAKESAIKAYPKAPTTIDAGTFIYHFDDNSERREGFIKGYEQAEKELAPLINRLCEAILFEWKDAADLARKTLTQIKARED